MTKILSLSPFLVTLPSFLELTRDLKRLIGKTKQNKNRVRKFGCRILSTLSVPIKPS